MKEHVRDAIRRSLTRLLKEDGYLFECPIEEGADYDARKLHEVCINHRLANHLEREILPLCAGGDRMFVDIEFNREGINLKQITMNGKKLCVRPDIIIHNRRTGGEKVNFLIVECKKAGSQHNDIDYDRKKVRALMEDRKYDYSFGLQVVYGILPVKANFFSRDSEGIEMEVINCS
jgi:hypothetical protein